MATMRLDSLRPSAMELIEDLRRATSAEDLWCVEISTNALAEIHATMADLLHALKNFQNYDMTLEQRQNQAIAAIHRAERSADTDHLAKEKPEAVDLMDALRRALPRLWHTCHDMNPPHPGPCAACAAERSEGEPHA